MAKHTAGLAVASGLFRALGHPFRLLILEALRDEEVCVCHLSASFGRPQPYVSKHLAELRDAGLVVDRREGLRIYYRLADPAVGTLLDGGRRVLERLGALPAEDPLADVAADYPVGGCECPRCLASAKPGNGVVEPERPAPV